MARKAKQKPSGDKPSTGEKVSVKVEFTQEERKDLIEQLCREMSEVDLKQESIKVAVAEAKAQLKGLQAAVRELANQLRNGYRTAEVDALVEFDRKTGTKNYFRHCPGQPGDRNFIKTENMTEDDFQMLPMSDPPPEKTEAPGMQ